MSTARDALDHSLRAALSTYANVHRGSGQLSQASTRLYEAAREVILEHTGLDAGSHTVVFATPRGASSLLAQLAPDSATVVSSADLGLPLGVRALVVRTRTLPGGVPRRAGGGTARLVGPGWVVWSRGSDRYEAGTPAILNVIALARALQLASDGESLEEADAPEQDLVSLLYEDALHWLSGRPLLHALRRNQLGAGALVPTRAGALPYVHLDHGASTPTFTPVWRAFQRALRSPAHQHPALITAVREECARFLGVDLFGVDLLFTANTTESIQLVAESLGLQDWGETSPVIVNTVLEHNSNELPWRGVPGASMVRLGVDEAGFVDLEELEEVLAAHNERHEHGRKRVALVAVTGASNVLGTCNDLAAMADIAHRHGARILVDGAQLVAHRKVDLDRLGVDYFVFSAHKAYAPFGVGVLLARQGSLAFDAEELGRIRAAGEENVAGIAALGKALVLLQRIGMDVVEAEERALTQRALRGLAAIEGLSLHGLSDPDDPRLDRRVGVVSFHLAGLMADRVGPELAARAGIGVRTGCHCAHMGVKRMLGISPALEVFQRVLVTVLPSIQLPGVVRASFGLGTTAAEVDLLVRTVADIVREPARSKEHRQAVDLFAGEREQRVFVAS